MTQKMKLTENRRDIVLTRADNGGWIVSERHNEFGLERGFNGAFTTTADMLCSLAVALESENGGRAE